MPVTAPTSKQARDRSAWLAARTETLLLLRQKFPQAFARLSGRTRKPLKIGIHVDIAVALPDLSPAEISLALRHYVSDLKYHRAVVEGASRIDLDGNAVGVVTAAEAENSRRIEAKLARRREHHTSARTDPPINKPRLTLSDLKAAALKRKLAQGA